MDQAVLPLFSIITVTYNAAHTIGRTLESVSSQTFGLYEHIIVDGAGSDATMDIVKANASERVRYISEPDRGIYDAMNKGMEMARGDYYIFLNAGDKFHDETVLQRMFDAIFADDYPGIVYGRTELVDDDGRYLGPRHLEAPEQLTLESFKQGMVVCHQAMAVYRKVAARYDLRYRYSSDYDWCIVCLQHSKRNVYIPAVLIDYLSEGTTTANHRRSLIERFKIMCHHYGTLPTVLRHAKFALRYLGRRKQAKNIQ